MSKRVKCPQKTYLKSFWFCLLWLIWKHSDLSIFFTLKPLKICTSILSTCLDDVYFALLLENVFSICIIPKQNRSSHNYSSSVREDVTMHCVFSINPISINLLLLKKSFSYWIINDHSIYVCDWIIILKNHLYLIHLIQVKGGGMYQCNAMKLIY